MKALHLVTLPPLMERTSCRPEVTIGLIDGPIAKGHPAFDRRDIREGLPGAGGGCMRARHLRAGLFQLGQIFLSLYHFLLLSERRWPYKITATL
jgi:hypothetical protein